MWKHIRSVEELESVFDESIHRPTVLFKHSTRCPLSSMVKRRFEADFRVDYPSLYLVDIIANREVSNEIASVSGVVHESPQLLILKDRQVTFHTSHGAIDGTKTSKMLSED